MHGKIDSMQGEIAAQPFTTYGTNEVSYIQSKSLYSS